MKKQFVLAALFTCFMGWASAQTSNTTSKTPGTEPVKQDTLNVNSTTITIHSSRRDGKGTKTVTNTNVATEPKEKTIITSEKKTVNPR